MYLDIDECSLGDTLCQQLCLNNDGGYTCACMEGYLLIEGTNQCEGNIVEYYKDLSVFVFNCNSYADL